MNLELLKETKNRFSVITGSEAKLVDEVNDALMWGAMKYLKKKGFTWLEVPTITKITGACENVDTLYALDHFGCEAYLAQTGQLYLEAKIPLHEKIWTVITSSRAEEEVDSRHLNQFQLVELEHQGNFQELLVYIEEVIKAMITEAMDKKGNLLQSLDRYNELKEWVSESFPKITYTQAIELLKGTEHEMVWGEDFTSAEENLLVSLNGNKPLFITHFPKKIKFFNMRQNDDNEEIVNSCDLIMPYAGESVGAAERENNYERLVARLVESPMFKILSSKGKTLADFKDYLDMVKKYPILHSGCGIGFGRVSQSILGFDDIRVSSNFPIQSNVLY